MADERRVVVIGGGIFGITTAIVLGEAGHRVTLLEKRSDLMQEASLVNQNRIHQGYHYPRSVETARESLHGQESFREFYGESIVSDFTKYYAIASEGSQSSVLDFERFCAEVGLPLEERWPDASVLNRDAVDACWVTPETIFDYHRMRHLAIQRVARCPNVDVVRSAWPTKVDVGPPHVVRVNDGRRIHCDHIVNATYSALSEVAVLMGANSVRFQFELCVMPIVEIDDAPERFGVTVMDGPFGSLMPRGSQPGQFICYHVRESVVQHDTRYVEPAWDPIEGLVEHDVIDACRELFPILERARWRESWISSRVVLAERGDDDARPTLLLDSGPNIHSIFSGKLTTCVDVARVALDTIEGRSSGASDGTALPSAVALRR